MAHSFTKIWIHGIFGTKDRYPLIKESFAQELYDHIYQQLEDDLNCKVRIINGMPDHIHMLFLLNRSKAIADIFKAIKGESSHWLNQQDFLKQKFTWQVGYGGFSISESAVERVENYIRNQKQHHKKMTFKQEYEQFLKNYGLLETVETVSG